MGVLIRLNKINFAFWYSTTLYREFPFFGYCFLFYCFTFFTFTVFYFYCFHFYCFTFYFRGTGWRVGGRGSGPCYTPLGIIMKESGLLTRYHILLDLVLFFSFSVLYCTVLLYLILFCTFYTFCIFWVFSVFSICICILSTTLYYSTYTVLAYDTDDSTVNVIIIFCFTCNLFCSMSYFTSHIMAEIGDTEYYIHIFSLHCTLSSSFKIPQSSEIFSL